MAISGGGLSFGSGVGDPNTVSGYQQNYGNALSLNQQNYNNILSGYQQLEGQQQSAQGQIQQGYGNLYNTVIGGIQGIGASQNQAINDAYAAQSGTSAQQMVSAGLGNTTVQQSVQRGNLLDEQKAKTGLANQIAALNAGYESNLGQAGLNYANQANLQNTALGSQQLGFMNSVSAAYPNAPTQLRPIPNTGGGGVNFGGGMKPLQGQGGGGQQQQGQGSGGGGTGSGGGGSGGNGQQGQQGQEEDYPGQSQGLLGWDTGANGAVYDPYITDSGAAVNSATQGAGISTSPAFQGVVQNGYGGNAANGGTAEDLPVGAVSAGGSGSGYVGTGAGNFGSGTGGGTYGSAGGWSRAQGPQTRKHHSSGIFLQAGALTFEVSKRKRKRNRHKGRGHV